jgi:hypothetical protein
MVRVALRAPPVFGLALNVTVPAAVPAEGETVTQLATLDAVQPQPAPAVTLTVPVPPLGGTEPLVAERENVHAAAAWVTATAWRATKTVVLRGDVELLGATVIVAAPGPLPDAGLTLAHTSSLAASHAQPLPAVTLTLLAPPDAPSATLVGDAEVTHGTTAAWLTVTGWPAMVRVAERLVEPECAATVTVAGPDPVPDAGLTLAQETLLDAVHEHPLPAVTVTLLDPPDAPIGTLAGAAEYVHAGTPAWVTVTGRPPIVSVAVRAVEAVLAATMMESVAVPVPDAVAGETHVALLAAVQAHVLPVVIVSGEVPAEAASDRFWEDNVYVQVGIGELTSVNAFEGPLTPRPDGPTAATRAS